MARVVPQPQVGIDLQRGASLLAACIRPTLGPLPRPVLATSLRQGHPPEALDGGALVARRIIELPERNGDVGAMVLRQLLLSLEESVGDGTATAAVIYETLLRRCMRLVAGGHDRVAVRRALDQAAPTVDRILAGAATAIGDRAMLEAVATAACGDTEVGRVLAEVFDLVGVTGRVELRSGHRPEPSVNLVAGSYWDWGVLVTSCDSPGGRVERNNACLVLTDLELKDPRGFRALLNTLTTLDQPVFITAVSISDACKALVRAQAQRFDVTVVRLPVSDRQAADLSDAALLTGGQPLLSVAGRTSASLRIDEVGQARHVWADTQHFGIVGGQGDRIALQKRLRSMRQALKEEDDDRLRRELLRRLGRLTPGSAVVSLGGRTAHESPWRKRQAQRAIAAIRRALDDGVVPGGGSALVAVAKQLRVDAADVEDPTSKGVLGALADALEAPLQALAANSGRDPAQVVDLVRSAPPGHLFDLSEGSVRSSEVAGIWDAAGVVRAAVRGAIVTVAQTLSVAATVRDRSGERKATA